MGYRGVLMKSARRNRLLAAALLVLAGCLNVSFNVDSKVSLAVDATGTTYHGTVDVDLSTNGDFRSHKDKVNGVSIEKVAVTVLSIDSGNVGTQLTSGTLSLRAPGFPSDGSQDVTVGTLSALVYHDYLVTSAGGGGKVYTMPLGNAQAVDAFLMNNVVRGTGKFTAVVTAQTDAAPTHITIQIDFSNSLSYGLL